MPTSQALSSDDPRMIAWNKYKETEEYSNTKGWAGYAQHVEGSLWAAFLVGWTMAGHDSAGAANSPSPEVRRAWEAGRDAAAAFCESRGWHHGSELGPAIRTMERNVSFGGSLGPLLRLKKSIPLTVERPFVLIWENTEEYSQGDSLGQAMDDFGISVRQLWEKVHDGSPLGPELLRIRSLLEEYIEPQPGPAAPPATKEGK